MTSPDSQRILVDRLRRGDLFDPPASDVRIVETHISWVLLAGAFAYKIKKPVNFGFVDFSTLERRRHFCEEELRLNCRLAPEIYLRVLPIAGTPASPAPGGAGAAIEYALVMRRFDDAQRADRLLAQGGLQTVHLEAFARELAEFHARTDCVAARESPDQPERAQHWVLENLDQIEAFAAGTPHAAGVTALRAWTGREYARLAPLCRRRLAEGRVRDAHGDLHLANLVLWEGRLRAFDCLEFNAELRRIDVASEVAFLFMDLEAHQRPELGWTFLNAYLEDGGDYGLCALLRYYAAYRALVRVKVECLNAAARGSGGIPDSALRYLVLVRRYSNPPPLPPLILMHGLSGSGKSRVALDLAARLGAVRVRSDVERRRLTAGSADGPVGVDAGAYRPATTERVYALLGTLANALLREHFPVIVDATFLKHVQRAAFYELARSAGIRCHVVHCTAPEAVLRERVRRRELTGRDVSEATTTVLEHQMRTMEPLREDEHASAITVDTGAADLAAQMARIAGTLL